MRLVRNRWFCLIVLVAIVVPVGSARADTYGITLDDGNDSTVSLSGQSVGNFLAAGACDGETFRTLIEFPDALIDSILPANARINSVLLQLNVVASCNANTGDYQVHRLLEPFDENTVTWTSQPDADFDTAYGIRAFGPTSTGLQTIDITDLVRYWFDNPGSNYGLMIKSADETFAAAIIADSSESSSATVRPTLIIDADICDPVAAIDSLIVEVVILNLQNGISNSLDAKLDAALNALDDLLAQNTVAAVNAMEAFINAVQAQAGNHIEVGDAAHLIILAEEVIEQIHCATGT